MEKGYLEGSRSSVGAGRNTGNYWMFTDDAIVSCLQIRPWLVDLQHMPNGYYREIVREEWEKDPWYSVAEVAPMLGVAVNDGKCFAVLRYIYRGWLNAEKKPGAPWQGEWVIRKSAIDSFLANDPRKTIYPIQYSQLRRDTILQHGKPVKDYTVWSMVCPACGEAVRISVSPRIWGPEVKELFMKYCVVDGECYHNGIVDLNT